MASVMRVAVAAAANTCVVPVTPVPAVAVVIPWFTNPLVPLKLKVPTAPLLILVTATVGSLVLVNVQAMLEPAAVAAASSTTAPVARLGVAVPPVPRPVQVAEAKT